MPVSRTRSSASAPSRLNSTVTRPGEGVCARHCRLSYHHLNEAAAVGDDIDGQRRFELELDPQAIGPLRERVHGRRRDVGQIEALAPTGQRTGV